MATNYFRGDAPAVSQVVTFLIAGSPAAGDTVYITIGQRTVTYTVLLGDTAATIATALGAALALASLEFAEVTWTVNTATITGTAATAGRPFTAAGNKTGTVTITKTDVTASSGPNHLDDLLNWSLGHVPQAGEDVIVGGVAVSILWGLDLSAVALASWHFKADYTGKVGLPRWNPSGYFEYRTASLKVRAPIFIFGEGYGSGSSFMRVDVGSSAGSAVTVYATGNATDQSTPALNLSGSHNSHSLRVSKGSIGLAFYPEETCSFPVVNAGYVDSEANDVKIVAGAGATLAAVDQNGGSILVQTAVTTWNARSGQGRVTEGGSVTTFNGLGAYIMKYLATGTIGTADLAFGSFLDCKGVTKARTITTLKMRKGSAFHDPAATCTLTNNLQLVNCGVEDVDLLLGKGITLARS